jgi:hypothetical protein
MRLALPHLVPLALVGLAACSTPTSPIPPAEAGEARSPVVVELFSSEGCSSCPPADIVLRDLARGKGAAEIIALEEHVDYWNHLGWSDPFSSPAWSERQRVYSTAMGHSSVYTPQVVIDGTAELVGSDKEGVLGAIAAAAKRPKARVSLSRDGDTLHIAISDLPAPHAESDVLVTITEDGLSTAIPRGENAGATVVHAPVARSMEKIGSIGASESRFVGERLVTRTPGWKKDKLRVIVLVQTKEKRAILGAGAIPWG